MSKWKCGICNSEFDNYQAQGFNGTIYCPLCYFKELYKREKTKNDKAIEYIKNEISLIDKDLVECELTFAEKWNFENERNKYVSVLEILGDKE